MDFQALRARRRAHKILALIFALVFFWGTASLAAATPVVVCGFDTGCLHCHMPDLGVLNGPACCRAPGAFSSVACCCSDTGMSASLQFVDPDSGMDGSVFLDLAAGIPWRLAGLAPKSARGSQDSRLSATTATVLYLQNLSLRL